MTFKEKVIKLIQEVPYGKVASYSQIALLAGSPRAARQVGSILNHLEHRIELPWWRVINNSGRISIKGSDYSPIDQKLRLESEGLTIYDDLSFEIEKYRWNPPQHFYNL
jgi:methylated-DNA-protein-cysteine methyltransferase-like protein